MGVGDIYIEPATQPSACPSLNQDMAWTGHLMWYELRRRLEDCCALCAQRYPCVAFTYLPHDASKCMLYDGAVSARAESGAVSGALVNHPAPPDCRTMGPPCACPRHTWATPQIDDMINASYACELMGSRVHFSGDSLIRDLWSATAIWLLRLEGFDPFFHSPGLYQHAACMANQWKYLENFGIIEQMQAKGWLRGEVFTVCHGRTELVFKYGRLFSDLEAVAHHTKTYEPTLATALIFGSGVLQMTDHGDSTRALQDWALAMDACARSGTAASHVVFMGTHHRIPELAPAQYAPEAFDLQGNNKIMRWNRIVSDVARNGSARFVAIDAYAITDRMDATYADTDDGMHMGFWVNLQKMQLVLMHLGALR